MEPIRKNTIDISSRVRLICVVLCCVRVTGYALDPSVDSSSQVTTNTYIGAVDEAEKNKGEVHMILFSFHCLQMFNNEVQRRRPPSNVCGPLFSSTRADRV